MARRSGGSVEVVWVREPSREAKLAALLVLFGASEGEIASVMREIREEQETKRLRVEAEMRGEGVRQ